MMVSSPHTDGQVGVLFAPMSGDLDFEDAHGFDSDAAEEQISMLVHSPA